ncbi:MAG: hypothetical protein GX259_05855 [Bacteroidales bacterium]|nr:hypothetical protein [Bacteroidales bacterium]
MATIGNIRKRSGLLIAIIGVALLLFILSDFLSSGSGGRRKIEPLAVVFGEKIDYIDFTNKLENRKEQYMMQYGNDMQFNGSINFQISNEVYEKMVEDEILKEEYEKLGLVLSDAEIGDMFTGYFVNPIVMQLFTNPETGVFDRNQVINFIENLDQQPHEVQQSWHMYENMIIEERYKQKYINLINKAFYIPKAFVDRDNIDKNKRFSVAYTGLRYSDINDSTVTVTEDEMKKYYESHKYNFIYEEDLASIDFVVFDVKPSSKDMDVAQSNIDTVFSQLKSVEDKDIVSFINYNSDIDYVWDSSFVKREYLPVKADTLFDASLGTTVRPYLENNIFFIHKLLERKSIPDSLKAAHILIAYEGALRADQEVTRTKDEAKKIADSLLAVVRGKDSTLFAQVAQANSNDPSAIQNGGYLGWFQEGSMVPEFNKACLDGANGSFSVVESDFGYHVIKVMGKTKPISKVKIATVKRSVLPSKETLDSVYNVANVFAAESKTAEAFEKNIVDKGYNKRLAERVRTTDYTVPGVEDGREIVRWAYNEKTEKDDVSGVFTLDNESKYVIAVLKNRINKDNVKFADVKDLVEPFAKREKKAQILLDKMNNSISGLNSIDEIASKINASVDSFDVTFSTYSLPSFGPEPEVVGNISATTQKNVISSPVKGESSVIVYSVYDITEAQEANADMIKAQKQQFFQSKVNYELFRSLKKKAKIKDNRILYF